MSCGRVQLVDGAKVTLNVIFILPFSFSLHFHCIVFRVLQRLAINFFWVVVLVGIFATLVVVGVVVLVLLLLLAISISKVSQNLSRCLSMCMSVSVVCLYVCVSSRW